MDLNGMINIRNMKYLQKYIYTSYAQRIIFFFCVSVGISLVALHTPVSAKKVSVDEICQIPVVIQAEVPEKVQKGKSFKLSNFLLKPGNTYGVTIASSITELSATNTNSKKFNQDFYKTDPSPTTGADSYTAFYPDWVIDANGEAGSSIEIKLVGSISEVADVGQVPCTFSKTLATIPIVSEQVESTPISAESSSPAAVVAMRVKILDNFGRPIKGAKVSFAVVEPALEATSDENGFATFDNVLSGTHTLIVKDGDSRITQVIKVSPDSSFDKTIFTFQRVAPPLYANPFFIGLVAVALTVGITGSMIYIIRRSKVAKTTPATQSAGPGLSTLIGSTNYSNKPVPTIIPEPSQPYGAPQSYQPSPAPWTLPVAPESSKQGLQSQPTTPTVPSMAPQPVNTTNDMVSDIPPSSKQAPQSPPNNPVVIPQSTNATTQAPNSSTDSASSAPQPTQQ